LIKAQKQTSNNFHLKYPSKRAQNEKLLRLCFIVFESLSFRNNKFYLNLFSPPLKKGWIVKSKNKLCNQSVEYKNQFYGVVCTFRLIFINIDDFFVAWQKLLFGDIYGITFRADIASNKLSSYRLRGGYHKASV
jgi:hypothetical protein